MTAKLPAAARSIALSATLATALSVASFAPAAAQAVPPSVTVLAHAIGMTDGMFSGEQEGALVGIAYQSAVARTCRGFAMDMEAYQGAVNALASIGEDLTDEQADFRDRIIMAALGMATGGFIAEFAADPTAFCEEADAFRLEYEGTTLFEG